MDDRDHDSGIASRLSRLERDSSNLFGRMAEVERMIAALPFVREDIRDIKKDCEATREWVEEQVERRRESDFEERRLSAAQKAAIATGIFIVLGSLITAIATFASTGVFG